MRIKFVLGLMAVTIVSGATAALAGSVPIARVGKEFQVNTYTSGNQYQSGRAICEDDAGNFVVVWQSGTFGGDLATDGDMAGIFGQRYASGGKPRGTEFQVNTFTPGSETDPAICCESDGDFTVAWTISGPVLTFFDRINGQRFASSGAPLGSEFQVTGYTSNYGFNADICCDDTGDFVVVWDAFYGYSDFRIKAQRFDSSAVAAGTEFQVNTYTSTLAFDPGVCCDATGNFVVAWSEIRSDMDFDSDVFGRRFLSDGSPNGTEFQVNTSTAYFQGQSLPESDYAVAENQALCCTPAGDFRVAWTEITYETSEIKAQLFRNDGSFDGPEFQVNFFTPEYQGSPAACCGDNGSFLVVWTSDVDPDDLDERFDVFARRFAPNGEPATVEFQVNTYTSGSMYFPTAACGADGGFVVSWSQYANHDGDQAGVFAQRFEVLDLAPTPALSWIGLVSGLGALLLVAVKAFRRRQS